MNNNQKLTTLAELRWKQCQKSSRDIHDRLQLEPFVQNCGVSQLMEQFTSEKEKLCWRNLN